MTLDSGLIFGPPCTLNSISAPGATTTTAQKLDLQQCK